MILLTMFLLAMFTRADWESDLIDLGVFAVGDYAPGLDWVVGFGTEAIYFFNNNHKCEDSKIDRPAGKMGWVLFPTCNFDTRPHDPSQRLRAKKCGANCCCPDGYYHNPSAIKAWSELAEHKDDISKSALGCAPCIQCSDFVLKPQCEKYSSSIKCDCNKFPDSFDDMCNADPIAYCNSYQDLKIALCGGSCNHSHREVCLRHFVNNGHKEIYSSRGLPACTSMPGNDACPASTVVGLNLSTRRGAGLITGCCNEDLNNEAGGDDIYLHAIRNNGKQFNKAISDLHLTNSNCPYPYKKLVTCCDGGDLNNNAGGDDIYLCYKEARGYEAFIVDLRLTKSRSCDGWNGWDKVVGSRNGGELNSNAGGDDIYLCMRKQKCFTHDSDSCGSNGNNWGAKLRNVEAGSSCKCAALCDAEASCGAWTYVPVSYLQTAFQMGSNDCVLRSADGGLIDNCHGECLSGVKSTTPAVEYVKASDQVGICPRGSVPIRTADECESAAYHVGETDVSVELWDSPASGIPSGCWIYNNALRFNDDPNSWEFTGNNGHVWVICKAEDPISGLAEESESTVAQFMKSENNKLKSANEALKKLLQTLSN